MEGVLTNECEQPSAKNRKKPATAPRSTRSGPSVRRKTAVCRSTTPGVGATTIGSIPRGAVLRSARARMVSSSYHLSLTPVFQSSLERFMVYDTSALGLPCND